MVNIALMTHNISITTIALITIVKAPNSQPAVTEDPYAGVDEAELMLGRHLGWWRFAEVWL